MDHVSESVKMLAHVLQWAALTLLDTWVALTCGTQRRGVSLSVDL
jgi:hypothetical protein